MSLERTIKEKIEYLTEGILDEGTIKLSYLQGEYTINVTINVKADSGRL